MLIDFIPKYLTFRRAQIVLQHLNETLMASSCSFQGLDAQMSIPHTRTLVSKLGCLGAGLIQR